MAGRILLPLSSLSRVPMVCWRGLPTPCGSSVRSLTSMSVVGEPQLEQMRTLSAALYKQGDLRMQSGSTCCNPYLHLEDVGPRHDLHVEGNREGRVREFLEVSAMIADYGMPELADQLSGAMYLHASITEDKCSQCIRLAETDIPNFTNDDIIISLRSMAWWPSESTRSMAVGELVSSLDSVCVDRLLSLQISLKEQLRLCYLWQSLICRPQVEFPATALATMAPFILQSSLPVLISYLLLLASLDIVPVTQVPTCESVCELLNPSLSLLTETELVAAYMGVSRLRDSGEKDKLRKFLENRYGYRL